MAYLVSIKERCVSCRGQAVERLFNYVNAALGAYCSRCARRALALQQQSEQFLFERQQRMLKSTAADV